MARKFFKGSENRVNAAGDVAVAVYVGSESNPRIKIYGDGKIGIGSGSGTDDVWISRDSAGRIAIDDALVVSGTIVAGLVTLTDGTTINTDASLGEHFRVTLGGNRTMANPTNPVDGQRIMYEIIQDGTGSRTITWGSKFAWGTDVTVPTLTTTANKRDFVGFVYNSTADKWFGIAVAKGY